MANASSERGRRVVIVADMVRGFCEPGHNLYIGAPVRQIVEPIRRLLQKERANGSHIIFLCDTHEPDDLEFNMFAPHCIRGTEEPEVIPELREFFSGQLRKVAETVFRAQGKVAPEEKDWDAEGRLFIEREDGAEWYGALNQARLALERRYKFGPTQEVTSVESFPAAKRSAFIRSQFYCALQSVLLEHVLD